MKIVILDRNGTLNVHREDFVKSDIEWTPLPGALEAVARLNRLGLLMLLHRAMNRVAQLERLAA